MATVADAAIAIRADMRGFFDGLRQGERATQGFAGRVSQMFSPRNIRTGAGLFGIGLGVRELVRFAGDAAESFGELEQTVETIDSVFGESADVIHDWGETAAETAGMSQQTFMSSAAIMGQTLKNMGFTIEDAAARTTQLLQRAADLAIAYGKRPQDALLAITAAMRGERDTIEKFGVAIKQVDVNARIAALGLDTSTAAAKKNAEAMAVVDLVLQQSTDSAGRFAEAEGDIAREMAIATSKWEDFIAQDVGREVASIQLGAIKVANAFGDATESIGDFFNLGQTEGTNRVAEQLGIEFREAEAMIEDLMAGSDLSFEMAVEIITDPIATSEAVRGVASQVKTQLEKSRPTISTAAEYGISDPIFDELLASEEAAGKSGHQVVIEYAKGLLMPQNDVQIAIDAALAVVEDEMGETEEYAYLSGQKVVLEEARGIALQEGKDAAVLAIDGALGLIEDRMEALTANAATHGGNLITSYVGGMYLNMPAISAAAYEMANRVSTQTRIESEPPDHNSPLYGITKWGGNLVDTYAGGIFAKLGTASSAAAALAGALTPPMIGSGAGMTQGGLGGGDTYVLQVEGKKPEVGARDDVLSRWEQMARLGR